jgi:hypothetical protein
MDDLIESAAQKLLLMSEGEQEVYLATAPDETKARLLARMRTLQQEKIDRYDIGTAPPAGNA